MGEHTKKKVEDTLKMQPDEPRPLKQYKSMKPIIPIKYEQSILLRRHECDICHRRFIRKQHMMRHRDTHADIRRFQCTYCHKRFSRREYHEKHQSECAKKFNQVCPETGQVFDSVLSAPGGSTGPRTEDAELDANVSFDQSVGDAILNSIEMKLKSGLRPSKVYPCESCERVFTRSDHLKRHSDTHSNFRPYNCSYCLRLFSRKENQKRHESLCKLRGIANGESLASGSLDFGESSVADGSENAFNDDEIGEPSFINDLDIDENGTEKDPITDSNGILSVEGNGSVYTIIPDGKKVKISSCPICARQFSRTDHLKRHIQTHDGIKRHQCQCCRKFFARQDYQVKHEKMCMIKNNYPMASFIDQKKSVQEDFWKMAGLSNDCDNVSSIGENNSIDDFDVDLMPEDENDFEDPYVDAVENSETKYAMPELSRAEYETQSCDTCSRVFQKRHHLRRHKISHLDHKPFQCTDCDQKFTRPEHMKRHLIKRHNKVIKSRYSTEETETEKFLINQPILRKKYIHRFADFARNFVDKTSTSYFEKCFDFVASMVIAHERGVSETLPKPTLLPPFVKQIKTEPDADPTGLFINVGECPDPLELLYDENDGIL